MIFNGGRDGIVAVFDRLKRSTTMVMSTNGQSLRGGGARHSHPDGTQPQGAPRVHPNERGQLLTRRP